MITAALLSLAESQDGICRGSHNWHSEFTMGGVTSFSSSQMYEYSFALFMNIHHHN